LIISVAIEKCAYIFNELDPAPFRKRDLDHDLRIYLEDSSLDIPLKHKIARAKACVNQHSKLYLKLLKREGVVSASATVQHILSENSNRH
jgi:hypothetical protein